MKIVIVVGTNRVGSMSKNIAQYLERLYLAEGVSVTVLDLSEMPAEWLNPDIYKKPKPQSFIEFHSPITEADGIVFVVPEYNGSFPGALKFYIDLWSYPDDFTNRCVAFVGISSNQWGALRPIEQLQGVFGYRNAFQFNERIFLSNIWTRWDFETQRLKPLHAKEIDFNELIETQTTGFIQFCRNNSSK